MAAYTKNLNHWVRPFLLLLLTTLVASCSKKEESEWQKKKNAQRAYYDCESIAYIFNSKSLHSKFPKTYEEFEKVCQSGAIVGGQGLFRDAKGKPLFDYYPKQEEFLVSKKLYSYEGKSYHIVINKKCEVLKSYEE